MRKENNITAIVAEPIKIKKRINKKMEYLKLTKENFDILKKSLKWNNPVCEECGDKITRDNFGLITSNHRSCNNLLCVAGLMEKIEEEEGEKNENNKLQNKKKC